MFAGFLRQSTTRIITIGPFVDATNGVTYEVGLSTLDAFLSKNAGTEDTTTNQLGTYIGHGMYPLSLTTTETNTLGELTVYSDGDTDARLVTQKYMVLPASVYDLLFDPDNNLSSILTTLDTNLDTANTELTKIPRSGTDWIHTNRATSESAQVRVEQAAS